MTMLKLAPLLLLAACATETTLSKPVEVKVPVPVPCHAPKVDEPDWPVHHLAQGADIYTQAKTLLAEIEARIGYEIELAAAVRACQ